MPRPGITRHRDFNLYWSGVILSEVGTRGTQAAVLYHVYELSGSTLQVGLVGLAQVIALLLLSPLGGAIADRIDRRRLLQMTQVLSLVFSGGLALVTITGQVQVWHILLAILLNTASASFERPARNALIPALVPRSELVQAFALLNPSREVAMLLGPAVGGLLIAVGGPQLMYLLDAASYVVLIVVLGMLRTPPLEVDEQRPNILTSIGQGARFVRRRPILLQFMGLDLAANVFGAYRALLPALATDVLLVGATGYGLLAAAPSAGALIGSAIVYRIVHTARSGRLVLGATVAFGVMVISLGWSGVLPSGIAFVAAMTAAAGIGLFDALASTIYQAAVQLETPDALRGRVTSLFHMVMRGGPSLGDLNMGWLGGLVGPVAALAFGGLVPIVTAIGIAAGGERLRAYQVETEQSET